jgi:hypothetical protein
MPLTDLESAWLRYAHDVVACDDKHLKRCQSLRKTWFGDCGLDDSVRWPGNLGTHYESASLRVLCLAQIHNDGHLAETLGHFQSVLCKFRKGSISPKEFLVQCREQYEKTIIQWGTWRRFYEIVPIPVTYVAYANIAKCWAPADQSKQGRPVNNQPAMKACNERFPITKLVSLLAPDLIVQIGKCDAVASADLCVRRFVVNNTDRPDSKAQRREAKLEIRRLFGDRLDRMQA